MKIHVNKKKEKQIHSELLQPKHIKNILIKVKKKKKQISEKKRKRIHSTKRLKKLSLKKKKKYACKKADEELNTQTKKSSFHTQKKKDASESNKSMFAIINSKSVKEKSKCKTYKICHSQTSKLKCVYDLSSTSNSKKSVKREASLIARAKWQCIYDNDSYQKKKDQTKETKLINNNNSCKKRLASLNASAILHATFQSGRQKHSAHVSKYTCINKKKIKKGKLTSDVTITNPSSSKFKKMFSVTDSLSKLESKNKEIDVSQNTKQMDITMYYIGATYKQLSTEIGKPHECQDSASESSPKSVDMNEKVYSPLNALEKMQPYQSHKNSVPDARKMYNSPFQSQLSTFVPLTASCINSLDASNVYQMPNVVHKPVAQYAYMPSSLWTKSCSYIPSSSGHSPLTRPMSLNFCNNEPSSFCSYVQLSHCCPTATYSFLPPSLHTSASVTCSRCSEIIGSQCLCNYQCKSKNLHSGPLINKLIDKRPELLCTKESFMLIPKKKKTVCYSQKNKCTSKKNLVNCDTIKIQSHKNQKYCISKIMLSTGKKENSLIGMSSRSLHFLKSNKKYNLLKKELKSLDGIPRSITSTLKWSNGWHFEGKPEKQLLLLRNNGMIGSRLCYPRICHQEGDIVTPRDNILLRSGNHKDDAPYVARVTALWPDPDSGEIMLSVLWYYRPEQTGITKSANPDEVLASKHRDMVSVACIEDRCCVLTLNAYCRYRKTIKAINDGIVLSPIVPENSESKNKLYPLLRVAPDRIFFCYRVFDIRQHRILKNTI